MLFREIRCPVCNKLLCKTDVQDGLVEFMCSRSNCKAKIALRCVEGKCTIQRVPYYGVTSVQIKNNV